MTIPTPETFSSTTLSESRPNTNQQQEQYQETKNRIIALKSRAEFLETQLLITKNVSKYLEKRLDDQKQYSRQPCLVVNGTMDPGEEDNHDSNLQKKIITTLSKESGIQKDIKKLIKLTHLVNRTKRENN